jgi:hypothetical protein
MSIPASTVGYFRNQWTDRFVDSCVVTRYDYANPTFNDTTGETEYPSTTPYSGECLVRPATAGHGEVDFGEDRRQEVDYDIYLPFDAATLENGDEVSVTADLDPNIPTLTVLKGFTDSYLTRRHYETKVISDD